MKHQDDFACCLPDPKLWHDLTPVAYICIDGFSICHFNETDRQWEIEFYHASGHAFNLGNNDTGNIPLNTTAESVTINCDYQDPYSQFKNGFYIDDTSFDRQNPNLHPNDFRWAVNIKFPHDTPRGDATFRAQPGYFTTKVVLPYAVMFAGCITPQSLYRVPDTVDPNTGNYEKFGYANDTLVAVMFSKDPELSLEIFRDDGYSEIHRLSTKSAPHMISLMNMRPHVHGEEVSSGRFSEPRKRRVATLLQGDFQLYYGAVAASKRWSLWGEPAALAPRGDRIDCDSVVLGDLP